MTEERGGECGGGSGGSGGSGAWGAAMSSPAVCSALYILDQNGKQLMSRDWRGDVPASCVDRFVQRVQDIENESEASPIIQVGDLLLHTE